MGGSVFSPGCGVWFSEEGEGLVVETEGVDDVLEEDDGGYGVEEGMVPGDGGSGCMGF